MAASVNDVFQKAGVAGTLTTLSAPGHSIAGTTITVGSTTNWPTDTGITFAIRTVDASGVFVAGTYTEWIATVSGSTLTGMVLAYGTDQNYTAGSTTQVYIPVSAYSYNRMIDGILVEHTQDGTHDEALITSRTEDTSPDPDADFVLTYDTSATSLKKAKISNLNGSATGWINDSLPTVSSVTNNGNGSYDVEFASTVASLLSPGMRLRTTRTVTAPTQCADLEQSSSQYFSKSSPSGMTFTDDFAVSAWVKLESYSAGAIVSRRDGSSGWGLRVLADGTVTLVGYNASIANSSQVTSYQSLPLGKWVHVAAQLDMSAFTATTTTSYVMFDGVDVPAVVSRTGTNPTALIQAGDLNIGAIQSAVYFDGKIAQVAIYSAKVTQATIKASISQTLSGSETSLISAYSFNGVITDLNTTNANDLTASGSAVATNADSPFANATGTPSGTTDVGLVMAVNTTTVTVQTPKGCTIPTSGGVTSVAYSTSANPFGWTVDKGKWTVGAYYRVQSTSTPTINQFTQHNSMQLTSTPVGSGQLSYQIAIYAGDSATGNTSVYYTLSTSLSAVAAGAEEDYTMSGRQAVQLTGVVNIFAGAAPHSKYVNLLSATNYYFLVNRQSGNTTIGVDADNGPAKIEWLPAGV